MTEIKTTLRSRAKSIFASKTVWGAVATFWVAISPTLQGITDQERWPTPSEWLNLITILVTTGLTIYGRYTADATLYTPEGLPGRNRPEDIPVEDDPTNS